MPFYNWSQTAASNATADSAINWAEGQAPSTVNDSARSMMAVLRKWGNDISGAIVTAGTSTAYTVTSNSVFDSLAHMDGQVIAFTPHTTNTAGSPNITLNVDSLGAKTIQLNPGVDVPAGFLVSGSPYVVLYNASNGVFYLQNSFANPYLVPVGSSIDFWGSTAPNSSFALMYGQAISRSTYATLFSLFGTTYGTGDGSTTFNVPDLRGRVIAGKDDMGGSAASRLTSSYFGASAATLGAVGGSESHALTVAQHATLTSTGTITLSPPAGNLISNTNQSFVATSAGGGSNTGYVNTNGGTIANLASLSGSNSMTTSGTGGTTGGAHNNTQPTIIANKLLRII